MNVSIKMLKNNQVKINDRLFDSKMNCLGVITFFDEKIIELKNGIHYSRYFIKDM
jgi:hypothetical protein